MRYPVFDVTRKMGWLLLRCLIANKAPQAFLKARTAKISRYSAMKAYLTGSPWRSMGSPF